MKKNKLPNFLKALGHPVRQQLLKELGIKEEMNVNELVKRVNLAQSTVSHHLAILKSAGVIIVREEGTQSLYRICCKEIVSCCERVKKTYVK